MIRKNSWHYKLISRFGIPKTKVGYWSMLLPACLAYSIPFLVLGLLVVIAGFAGTDISGHPFSSEIFNWMLGFVTSIVGVIVIIFTVIAGVFTMTFVHDTMYLPFKQWVKSKVKFKKAEYQ